MARKRAIPKCVWSGRDCKCDSIQDHQRSAGPRRHRDYPFSGDGALMQKEKVKSEKGKGKSQELQIINNKFQISSRHFNLLAPVWGKNLSLLIAMSRQGGDVPACQHRRGDLCGRPRRSRGSPLLWLRRISTNLKL